MKKEEIETGDKGLDLEVRFRKKKKVKKEERGNSEHGQRSGSWERKMVSHYYQHLDLLVKKTPKKRTFLTFGPKHCLSYFSICLSYFSIS